MKFAANIEKWGADFPAQHKEREEAPGRARQYARLATCFSRLSIQAILAAGAGCREYSLCEAALTQKLL